MKRIVEDVNVEDTVLNRVVIEATFVSFFSSIIYYFVSISSMVFLEVSCIIY